MSLYVKMADILTPCKVGEAEVDILDYTNKKLGFWENMSLMQHEKYARLLVGGDVMMSETPMEHRTNRAFVQGAYGDILIGGLGIGMIVLAIQGKPDVNSITIIEYSKDVIDAIKPQLPLNSKVKIIQGDVFTYKPKMKYDCIYMDIWAYINSDIYNEQMKPLKRKYGHYLKSKAQSPNRFNACWCEYEAKHDKRIY